MSYISLRLRRFFQHSTVAGISVGATRTFKLRATQKPITTGRKSTSTKETAVKLQSGSLTVLFNGIEHTLPKEKGIPLGSTTNRVNITFRCLKPYHRGDLKSAWGHCYHYNRGVEYSLNSVKQ